MIYLREKVSCFCYLFCDTDHIYYIYPWAFSAASVIVYVSISIFTIFFYHLVNFKDLFCDFSFFILIMYTYIYHILPLGHFPLLWICIHFTIFFPFTNRIGRVYTI